MKSDHIQNKEIFVNYKKGESRKIMNKSKIKKLMRKEFRWITREVGNRLVFNRAYTAKNIEFSLLPVLDKIRNDVLYKIQHPSYLYISTISHFKSVQSDVRLSLNKVYLRSIIRLLKRVGIWPHIINKNFIQINDNNPKSNKRKVEKELKELLKIE